MRTLILLVGLLSFMSIIYKWRYKIINTILTISVFRQLVVLMSMNMSALRNKLI